MQKKTLGKAVYIKTWQLPDWEFSSGALENSSWAFKESSGKDMVKH